MTEQDLGFISIASTSPSLSYGTISTRSSSPGRPLLGLVSETPSTQSKVSKLCIGPFADDRLVELCVLYCESFNVDLAKSDLARSTETQCDRLCSAGHLCVREWVTPPGALGERKSCGPRDVEIVGPFFARCWFLIQ